MFGLYSFSSFPINESGDETLQRIVPDSDISKGTWLPRTGSNLYPMLQYIDIEDQIYNLNPTTSQAEVSFPVDVEDPNLYKYHMLEYTGSGSYTVYLKDGTTTIASWTENDSILTSHERELTQEQILSITNYSNLRIVVSN